MSNIYQFGTPAETDDADKYIEQQKGKFKSVIMIGLDEDDEPVFGANGMSARDAIYLLELIKLDIMENWVNG